MNRKITLILLFCVLVAACDTFPGPTLRNEFATEVEISILYGNGSRFSSQWPSCQTVFIGATEAGRFGQKEKHVSVDQISIIIEEEVVLDFNREAINRLLEKANAEKGIPIWVLDRSGVHFSTDRKCSISQ